MRLIDADEMLARLEKWNTSDLTDKALYNFTLNRILEQPSIEPEQHWAPCSERPDTDRNVFIARGSRDNMTVCIGHYDYDYKEWYEDRNWFATILYDELYWCEIPPLPAPYKEGEK